MSFDRKKITYPSGIYEYLARKANAAVGATFITISFPVLEIKFLNASRKGSQKTVDWLFEELSQRIVNISKKYKLDLGQSAQRRDLMIDYKVKQTSQQINITGYHHIPIKSFGNILDIVLWSYIIFITGHTTSEDKEAKELHQKYLESFKEFKNYWNRMPRKKLPLLDEKACFICGKEAFALNSWIYKSKGTSVEIYTPVCKTHRNRLI